MSRKLLVLLFIGLFINSLSSRAQINLEIYGGPNISYMEFETTPSNVQARDEVHKKVSYHLGLGVLTRITDNWQLVTQAEMFVRSMALRNPGDFRSGPFVYDGSTIYEMPTFALGARYTIDKDKYGFFLQPGIGFTLLPHEIREPNPFFDHITPSYDAEVIQNSPFGIGLRFEAGIKRYTKKRNYFMIGIRHQQGLRVTDEIIKTYQRPGQPEVSVHGRSRSSYTGLFIGYGLNTGNWRK